MTAPKPTTSNAPAAAQPPTEERQELEYTDLENEDDVDLAPTPEELAEAKNQLEKMTPESFLYLVRKLEAYKKQEGFPEARSIGFTEFVSKQGIIVNITTRGASMEEVIDDIARGIHYAKTRNLFPNKKFIASRATMQTERTTTSESSHADKAPAAQKPAAQQPAAQAKSAPQKTEAYNPEDFFETAQLIPTKTGGKVYWAISSKGNYPKFPTRVWKEPLLEFNMHLDEPSEFDPDTTYDFYGYRAYYVRNANGNPSKVVKLAVITP